MIETECLAISFRNNSSLLEKNQCYLFKKDFGVYNYSTGWISYIKAEKKFNTQLHRSYKTMHVYHEIVCWEECEKDHKCEAISIINEIGLQECFLFDEGFSLEPKKNWLSYFRSKAFLSARIF